MDTPIVQIDTLFAFFDTLHFLIPAGVCLLEVRTGSNVYITKIEKARL